MLNKKFALWKEKEDVLNFIYLKELTWSLNKLTISVALLKPSKIVRKSFILRLLGKNVMNTISNFKGYFKFK